MQKPPQLVVGNIFERVAGITFASLGIASLFAPFDVSPFLRTLFTEDVSSLVFSVLFSGVGIVRFSMSFCARHEMFRIGLSMSSAAIWAQWVAALIYTAIVQGGVLRPGIFHVSAMVVGEIILTRWLVLSRQRMADVAEDTKKK